MEFFSDIIQVVTGKEARVKFHVICIRIYRQSMAASYERVCAIPPIKCQKCQVSHCQVPQCDIAMNNVKAFLFDCDN